MSFHFFKKLDDLVSRNGGKVIQKLVQRLIPFNVVKEVLDWNTSPLENRSSPHDFQTSVNYV